MIVVVVTVPYISGSKIDRMIAYESSVDGFTGSCWILNVVGHCVLGDSWKEWESWHVVVVDWIARQVLGVLVGEFLG